MKKLLYLFLCLFVLSCGEEAAGPGKPEITGFSLTKFNDTLLIYGNNLGPNGINDIVVINDSIYVPSKDASEWSDKRIIVPVPLNAVPGHFFVIINSDTTASFNLVKNANDFVEAVLIKSGSYVRGSDKDAFDEKPAKSITISKDFFISKFEVNQRLYSQVSGYNPSSYINSNFPVHAATWIDAVIFCNKLSQMEGLTPAYTIVAGSSAVWDTNSTGWRLPTEAEWEFACRAGTQSDYSGTGKPVEMGWYNSNSGNILHSGGMKSPNDWGIYDMHGNLWEWCWDFYNSSYYSSSEDKDPKGPVNGSVHVMKGGSYSSGLNYIRSSNRKPETENINPNLIGFRIVRNVK